MAKSFEQKVITFKAETTVGTDATPDGTNAFRVLNFAPIFMTADGKVRQVDKGYLGADPVVMSAIRRGATFEVEMSGSGATATTPAGWMALLRMAAFGAAAVGASAVTSSPAATATSMTMLAAFLDEVNAASNSFLMKALGCRASVGFRITDDDFPVFTFNVLGVAPQTLATEGAMLVPTIAAQAEPVIASNENTTFTLDGYALPLRSAEFNANADLQLRSLIGAVDFVAYRQRSWSGQIVAEVPNLATKDYFAKIRPGSTMAMAIVHGTATGNIVGIDAPKVQITGDVALSEEQGKLMMTLPCSLLPSSGNDEVVFTSK